MPLGPRAAIALVGNLSNCDSITLSLSEYSTEILVGEQWWQHWSKYWYGGNEHQLIAVVAIDVLVAELHLVFWEICQIATPSFRIFCSRILPLSNKDTDKYFRDENIMRFFLVFSLPQFYSRSLIFDLIQEGIPILHVHNFFVLCLSEIA